MAKLYIVPTPIGNLEDITLRALRILREVDAIVAEDTRTTKILLSHYDIKTPLMAHHMHNEHRTSQNIAQQILHGKTIALCSDAGTPCISDPGFLLARTCIECGIEVECLPGATAMIPAIAASGLACERFCFEGFLPFKKGRQSRIHALQNEERTIIFYESPHRLLKLLEQLSAVMGDNRHAVVSREISKLHQQTIRGTLSALLEHFREHAPRGEFVVMLQGACAK
jgi:16S rRNA (cytidine1402-2'-O)-methyltransferase